MNEFRGLHFQYNGDGDWEANSAFSDEGFGFIYRIHVCDDGTFTVNESDSELIGSDGRPTFDLFKNAKEFCIENERKMYLSEVEAAK